MKVYLQEDECLLERKEDSVILSGEMFELSDDRYGSFDRWWAVQVAAAAVAAAAKMVVVVVVVVVVEYVGVSRNQWQTRQLLSCGFRMESERGRGCAKMR